MGHLRHLTLLRLMWFESHILLADCHLSLFLFKGPLGQAILKIDGLGVT